MSPTATKSSKTTIRAITYCRISSDPTGHEAGVERQHLDTDRLAEDRGWTVVERIVDNDRSASQYATRRREGWARVMEMIERGEVDALVAYDLDRLTRQPTELERLITAADHGLAVATATGQLDLSSTGGKLVGRMLCNVAAHEADRVRDRMKAKLRHDAENGKPHWARRPFGYTRAGEVVADEAEWIRTMSRWILENGTSATMVAKRLNEAGVQQASGCPWQGAGVKMVLMSPRTMGMRTYNNKVVGKATWPAILDEETWRATSAALGLRSYGVRTARRSMLTGMVRCGVCGETMVRTNGSRLAQWRCTKRPDIGTGCGQAFNARALDTFIVEMVLIRIGDVTARTKSVPGGEQTEADQIRADLDSLATMLGNGQIGMTEWTAARAPLQARLDAAESATTRSDAASALARLMGNEATLAERWPDLDVDLQRRLIGLVLDRVVVTAGKRGVLDLDRVKPIWRA